MEEFILKKSNFDLNNIETFIESNPEAPDTKYDHRIVSVYFPARMTDEEITKSIDAVFDKAEKLKLLQHKIFNQQRVLENELVTANDYQRPFIEYALKLFQDLDVKI